MPTRRLALLLFLIVPCLVSSGALASEAVPSEAVPSEAESSFPSAAHAVEQAKGADPTVDYAALLELGPWDDRNYQLTAADLAVLPASEAEQRVMVPAFYRVELRRRYPDMRRTGDHQYPRSTLPRFRTEYGGYLIDGQLYRSARRAEDRYVIDLEDPWMTPAAWTKSRALDGEVRVAPGAETAIAIHPTDVDTVIAGSNGAFGGQEMFFSSDGGSSWTSAGSLPNSCCDPTVAFSSDGARAYTVTLGAANDVYLSTDDGQSWSLLDTVGSGFVDKEYLHVDTHAGSPHLDNLYLTWHLGGSMRFSRSLDQGATWSPQETLSSGAQDGIGSDITSDRAGRVFYIWPTFSNGRTFLRRSTDGGATFEPAVLVADTVGSYEFPLPAMSVRRVFMYVSVDADLTDGPFADSIYVAYTDATAPTTSNPADNHGRIQVARSRDGGATWTINTPHETDDALQVDRFHPWLAVGPDGKVWVVYYDTRNDPSRESVDFYYSVSEDGAVTWSTPERLTSVTSPKPNDSFEWGDYNGMDLVMDQLMGIYTDNRNEGGGGGDSIDVYVVGTVTASAAIFADGFEAGTVAAWTSSTP